MRQGRGLARREAARCAPTTQRPGAGAIILLAAAGATVLAGSLTMRLGPGWYQRLLHSRPRGVIIHHSASEGIVGGRAVGAETIDAWHETRGWGVRAGDHVYHIGYHYVIRADGVVEPGRPEWMRGAHTIGHNDCIGICLVGDFEKRRPTAAQLRATVELIATLMDKYHLTAADVHGHRDYAETLCPGRLLDVAGLAKNAASR